MRLLKGGSLDQRMRQRIEQGLGLPSLAEVLRIFEQLASALDYAHARGVIHRDIKPNNVMFDEQGNALLVDFGIAKLMSSTHQITSTGLSLGTPAYMAPEQWNNTQVTPATDQYALTGLLYALLSGEAPFKADTPFGYLHAHMYQTPPTIHIIRPDIPHEVHQVIMRGMAKNPADRYPNLTMMAQALRDALGNSIYSGITTNFTVFPLKQPIPVTPYRQTPLSTPYTPKPMYAQTPSQPIPMSQHPSSGNPILLFFIGILILVLVGLSIYVISRNSEPTLPLNNNMNLSGAVVILSTETNTASPTITDTALPKPTQTDIHTPTPTSTATDTPTLSRRQLENTQAAYVQQTLHVISTETQQAQDIQVTIQRIVDLTVTARILTETANAPTFTVTPSPTSTPTLTDTPTYTYTPTSTATPSTTPSATPTHTPTATFTPTPRSTITPTPRLSDLVVTNNRDWQVVQTTINGVEMVLVPRGCFEIGSRADQLDFAVRWGATYDVLYDESPPVWVCIDRPFWIDVYEVTNSQFQRFNGRAGRNSEVGLSNYPRTNITWQEAQNFCQLRGGSLPTEAQWEYAGRGPSDWWFPWGNESNIDSVGSYMNFCDTNCDISTGQSARLNDNFVGVAPVGSYPRGASWVGAQDMSGNVREMTLSPYVAHDTGLALNSQYSFTRITKGGNFRTTVPFTRLAHRGYIYETDFQSPRHGFRCVLPYNG